MSIICKVGHGSVRPTSSPSSSSSSSSSDRTWTHLPLLDQFNFAGAKPISSSPPPELMPTTERRRAAADDKAAVLSVSISSAVRLEERQMDMIAWKMRKLTGSSKLSLTNTVDPSLIAGFVISYGGEGDSSPVVVDLSVRTQLATMAAKIESIRWSKEASSFSLK